MTKNLVRSSVERFHLALLRVLTAGPNVGRLALKGGCNLRFFFGSVRYSEDLDVDCQGIAVGTLRGAVDRALGSDMLRKPLRRFGIEVAETSKPVEWLEQRGRS